jgi:site-specific DNA-methyltransferase (adenine-specific)
LFDKDAIRDLRRSLRLTQVQFSQIVPVHRSTVSRWECGKHLPRGKHQERLRRLADGRATPTTSTSGRAIPEDRYHLLQADCLTYLDQLPENSVDAVITDPPYASGGLHAAERSKSARRKYEQNGIRHHRADFEGDQRDQRSWMRWCLEWLGRCRRVLKPGGVVAIFADWRQEPALSDVVQMADFLRLGVGVWDKTEAARPAPGRLRNQCEFVVWGSKGSLPKNRDASIQPGVHREAVRQSDKHHLTGKPVGLMRWLCKLCVRGGLILDPFAGSGSTGVAALLEGRRFIGIEREAHYHEIAARRLEAAAQGKILTSKQSGGQAVAQIPPNKGAPQEPTQEAWRLMPAALSGTMAGGAL